MLKTIACLSLLILVGCSEDSSTTPAPSGVSLQLSPTSDAEVLSVVLRNNSTVDLWLDSRGFFWTSIYDKQGTSLVTPPPPPPPPYDQAKHRYLLAAGEEFTYERNMSSYIELNSADRNGFFVQVTYNDLDSGDPSIFSREIASNFVWVKFP